MCVCVCVCVFSRSQVLATFKSLQANTQFMELLKVASVNYMDSSTSAGSGNSAAGSSIATAMDVDFGNVGVTATGSYTMPPPATIPPKTVPTVPA